jgi:hypothetical protein
MYLYNKLGLSGNSGLTISPFHAKLAAGVRAAPIRDMRFGPPPDSGKKYRPTDYYPFARIIVNFNNIFEDVLLHCVCYENMPREEITDIRLSSEQLDFIGNPYTLEVHPIGHSYVCDCRTKITGCPESVHRGADPRDPWRQRQCADWEERINKEIADTLSTKNFRKVLAQRVFKTSGLQSWRGTFLPPAEFTQVLIEREVRAKPYKVIAPLVIAVAGSVIAWQIIRKKES